MERRKLLYVAQEITPYLPSTPLAVRTRAIAEGAANKGWEIRSFMPKYSIINERRNQLHEVIRLSGINIIIDDTDHPLIIKVATLLPTRMQVYFIDNDDYFGNANLLSKELETLSSPHDNDERLIFFTRGVAETVKKLRWAPEVIHVSGWLGALAPLYLKKYYGDDPAFRDSKIVYSITEGKLPATLPSRLIDLLKQESFTPAELRPLGKGPEITTDELLKLAVAHADAVVEETAPSEALAEVLAATKKPVLSHQDAFDGDDAALAEAVRNFYDTLK